jgi:ankyrin repeat protein
LLAAGRRHDVRAIKWELDQIEEINHRNETGQSLLWCAAVQDSTELVEMLLARGANPDLGTSNGSTPLQFAAISQKASAPQIADLLVTHGARIEAPYPFTAQRPLQMAAYSGNLDIVRLLIAQGASVDARDTNGFTPLLSTVVDPRYPKSLDVVKLLVAHGADVNARSHNGWTVWYRTGLRRKSEGQRELRCRRDIKALLAAKGAH